MGSNVSHEFRMNILNKKTVEFLTQNLLTPEALMEAIQKEFKLYGKNNFFPWDEDRYLYDYVIFAINVYSETVDKVKNQQMNKKQFTEVIKNISWKFEESLIDDMFDSLLEGRN